MLKKSGLLRLHRGGETFADLGKPRDLAKVFDTVEYAKWKSFRDGEDSRYVGLTMPRFLGLYVQDWQYLFTVALVAIVPVAILFGIIEKRLIGGLTSDQILVDGRLERRQAAGRTDQIGDSCCRHRLLRIGIERRG